MFCVECGSEEMLFGSLCRKCLLSKRVIKPPSHIELEMCHLCGNFFDHGKWKDLDYIEQAGQIIEANTETYKQIESIRWEIPEFEPSKGEHHVVCHAIASVGGKEFCQDFDIGIRIRVQTCPSCSRQNSDYFEAIIQLRRDNVSVKNAERELAIENQQILNYVDSLAGNEENAFLTKWGTVPGGMDYYIGSMALARNIVSKMRENLGATIKESNTIIGMRDGHDIYRYTFLVRLPAYGRGDIVAYDKKLFVVDSVSPKVITLKSVRYAQIYKITPGDTKIKLVSKYSELLEAIVVSHDKTSIQILDPESMKTVTVLRPRYLEHIGESVLAVWYDERLHAV